ncbi:MAG: 16S rRNA (guanine(966)-N(2))-methyltransferase RsmD [Firmicutes bacterium]|nr:16S rRNA (guanine(966)-N(2))-methyltransferase RsmD [Bacillota bacterium]
MRIISGNRRGHKLTGFDGRDVRPTTDRVKESLFNIISPFIPGAYVLDLFAGSGALSMEALSRGAAYACCVDKDKRSIDIINRNVKDLKYDGLCTVAHSSYEDFLSANTAQFDIIFLDPPYNKGFIEPVLKNILKTGALGDGGIVALESDETDFRGEAEGFSIYRQKKYGRTYITIYTNAEG